MKVFLFSNTDWYLFNFRRPLIHRLTKQGYDVVAVTPSGPFQERLRQEGIECLTVPVKRTGAVGIKDLGCLIKLWRLYREHQPEVVHHFTLHAAVFGMLCAKLARVPRRINAITGLGYFSTGEDRQASIVTRLLWTFTRWLFGGSRTHIVLQNKTDYEFFRRNGIGHPPNLYLIFGSGLDVEKYEPKEKNTDSAPVKVLMASRVLIDKGIREYIEVVKAPQVGEKKIEFLLAGDVDRGNPSGIDEKEILSWHKIPNFTYLGYQEDMHELLRSADVFVLPSYREGLPRSLLEAAACELPIVTTDVPGCNEVVVHELNGLLVPARDAKALGEAIHRLVEEPTLRAEFGRKGRERVSKLFSESMVLEETLRIYKGFDNIKAPPA